MALIVSHGRCQQTIGRAAEGNGAVSAATTWDRHTKMPTPKRPAVRSSQHNQWHLLDDVENSLVLVQPQVMVGYCHGLERDLFGIFEVRIRPPHALQPLDVQQPGRKKVMRYIRLSYHVNAISHRAGDAVRDLNG
jgi:hypothetical protein